MVFNNFLTKKTEMFGYSVYIHTYVGDWLEKSLEKNCTIVGIPYFLHIF